MSEHNKSTSKKVTIKKARAPKKKIISSVGLGDVIEKVTKATGIKKMVEVFSEATGIDCGCDERKEALNKYRAFSTSLKPRCITADEFVELNELLKGVDQIISKSKAKRIAELYSSIFSTKFEIWCAYCGELWRGKISHLQVVLEVYQEAIDSEGKEI